MAFFSDVPDGYEHFSVELKDPTIRYRKKLYPQKGLPPPPKEKEILQKKLRRAKDKYGNDRKKMREQGFKSRYFQFKRGDEKAEAAAKEQAEAYAAEWKKKTGRQFRVFRGCFL